MFSKKWDIFQAFSQRNIAKTRDRKAESGNRCCFSLHKIGCFNKSVLKCSQNIRVFNKFAFYMTNGYNNTELVF